MSLLGDLRQAGRQLAARPGFTLAAVIITRGRHRRLSRDLRKVTAPRRPLVERVRSRAPVYMVAVRNQVVREVRAARFELA